MKIIVEYDESLDQVRSKDGMILWTGPLEHWGEYKEQSEQTQETSKVSSVIELKKAGFSAQEIVEMTRGGVL